VPVFPSCTSAHTRSLTSCDLPSFNISTSEQAENPDAAGKKKKPAKKAAKSDDDEEEEVAEKIEEDESE
jgi:hypothetical protein